MSELLREKYQRETGKQSEIDDGNCGTRPSWDYVSWLENKLTKNAEEYDEMD